MKKFLVLFIIFSSLSIAQIGSSGTSDARSMGMAKTYNAVSKGIFSVGINPANLLAGNNTLDISTIIPLPKISLKSGTDFLSLNEFNYFFGGVDGESRILNDQDKEKLYNLFSEGGLIYASLNTNLFGLAFKSDPVIGAFAFSINDYAGGNINFPGAIIELALSGNEPGKKYLIENEEIKSWWLRSYSISYAKEIASNKKFFDNIYAGISLKLIHGYYYIGTERIDSYLQTDSRNEITGSTNLLAYTSFSPDFNVKYDFEEEANSGSSGFGPFMSPAGNGFGLDLGLTALINKNITVSFSVTDVGDITWKEKTAKFVSSGSFYIDDITEKNQIDSIKEKLTAEGSYTSEFKTSLATALRLGAAYQLKENLLLAFDYNQGFNNLPGNSKEPRFSIGAEWKPGDWIPYFRSGFSIGGIDGFGWALGLGIDAGILELNIATSDMHSYISPNSAKFISIAFDSRWKF